MTGDPGAPTAIRYGAVAQALHWLIAALAVVIVTLGLAATSAPHNSAARDDLLMLHRSVGLTILALMVVRAAWRRWHPPPPLPATLARIEARLAHSTHIALYILFILMPMAGYLVSAGADHAGRFFGLAAIPRLIPVNPRLAQWAIAAHLLGQYLVYVIVGLHVAGAAYHALLRRDGVFERMLPVPGRARFGG